MSRKDYELIAAAIHEQADTIRSLHGDHNLSLVAVEGTARRIARALSMENPRFDMARFFAACGF